MKIEKSSDAYCTTMADTFSATSSLNACTNKKSRKSTNRLSRGEEWQLIMQARSGDNGAFRDLLDIYEDAIRRIAGILVKSGATRFVPLEDIVQEGTIGLWQSVDRYEMKTGASFYTYASHRIHGAMIDALRMNSGSRTMVDLMRSIDEAYGSLAQELLRKPTSLEMKSSLSTNLQRVFDEVEVFRAWSNSQVFMSNNEHGNKLETIEMVPSSSGTSVEDEVSIREEKAGLKEFIKQAFAHSMLTESQKETTLWYYQSLGGDGCTLSDLGRRLGICGEGAFFHKKRGLEKMRKYLVAHFPNEIEDQLKRLACL